MKFLNLYLIIPFLTLSYANIGAFDSEAPAIREALAKQMNELGDCIIRKDHGYKTCEDHVKFCRNMHTGYFTRIVVPDVYGKKVQDKQKSDVIFAGIRSTREIAAVQAIVDKFHTIDPTFMLSDPKFQSEYKAACEMSRESGKEFRKASARIIAMEASVFKPYTDCVLSAYHKRDWVSFEPEFTKCKKQLAAGINKSLKNAR